MNLQDTFYIIGIIGMVLYTILLIVAVIALIYIATRIKKLYTQFESKVESVKVALNHPEQVASEVGAALASTTIDQVGKVIKNRRGNNKKPRSTKRR